MTQRAMTSLSIHYHVKPGQKEALLVEIRGILDRCAKEPEFIAAIVHETPERPNEFVFYELWKGARAEFDAIQGPKPYRKAYRILSKGTSTFMTPRVPKFQRRTDPKIESRLLQVTRRSIFNAQISTPAIDDDNFENGTTATGC
jgi:quinol monooxygenase YgiN